MGKGRAPCCAKVGLNKGCWTPEEDMRLIAYIQKYGHANWRALPKQAGLLRCGKSCRLRWINYLRPDLKRGNFTVEEEETIIKLHCMLGNKWSKIAACLPGRTDNEIKNVWNTHLKKRVAPCGEQQEHSTKKKNKKSEGAEVTAVPSLSPTSSTTTTTTNCSSNDSGEQQSNAGKEPDELDLRDIEIPMLDTDFDLDALVDPVPDLYFCPSVSLPTSPCASSTSPPAPPRGVVDDLLELAPEIDIDQELWSIIDCDVGKAAVSFTESSVPCHGNATVANPAASSLEEGKEWWWLENLERELGLWGPMEDYQQPTVPLGLAHPDSLLACCNSAGPSDLLLPSGTHCSHVVPGTRTYK